MDNNNYFKNRRKNLSYIVTAVIGILRAKFRNDSNFLVREIGRGRCVEERSLEMAEVKYRQRLMKLFLYLTVHVQLEITGSNAVFSEDCKGSMWKSCEGGDDVNNV